MVGARNLLHEGAIGFFYAGAGVAEQGEELADAQGAASVFEGVDGTESLLESFRLLVEQFADFR
jgi:hypothetical protein